MGSLKDLDHMDNVINRTIDGFTFTPAVPIYTSGAWKMEWEKGDMHGTEFSADASVPIAEAVGLSVHAKAALAFKNTVQNYRMFDKLDRYIILPTRGYIEDILEDDEVQSHIQRSKSTLGAWSLLLVTGVAVARGSHGSSSDNHERSATVGGGAGITEVASADVTATASSAKGTSISTGAESDFVWAVRVCKIWKGTLDRTWSYKTQSKGATFSLEDEERKKEELIQALEAEGTGEAKKLWYGTHGVRSEWREYDTSIMWFTFITQLVRPFATVPTNLDDLPNFVQAVVQKLQLLDKPVPEPQRLQWPLTDQTRERTEPFSASQYPTLVALLGTYDSSQVVLIQYAEAKFRRNKAAITLWKDMIDAFEAFAAPESETWDPDLLELAKTAVSKEELEDNHGFVLQLYDALFQHFNPSRCPYDWQSIVVNLRLNWSELSKKESDNDSFSFGLFIMIDKFAAPGVLASDCFWQDIQVCVSKLRTVTFDDSGGPQPAISASTKDTKISENEVVETLDIEDQPHDLSSSEAEAADDLCQHLKDFTKAQISFEYTTDFKFRGRNLPIRKFSRSSLGVPLSDLIGCEKLTEKMKLSLSFLLVRTFWQYCNSDWMRDDWSKESVHFMLDKVDNTSKVISVHEPFLRARFNKADHIDTSQEPSKRGKASVQRRKALKRGGKIRAMTATHRYPKLLALGIMLLEIELDRKLETLATPDEEESNIITLRHGMATDVLNNPLLWPSKGVWTIVKESIKICVEAGSDVLGGSEQDLRHNFYRRVVRPFKAFLEAAWSDADYQTMDPVTLENAMSPASSSAGVRNPMCAPSIEAKSGIGHLNMDRSLPQAEIVTPMENTLSSDYSNQGSGVSDTNMQHAIGTTLSAAAYYSPFTSANWFAKLDDLNYVLQIKTKRRDEHSKPIRVAILDTGVDEFYYQNDLRSTKSIKAYKDFVSANDSMRQDGTGHGTTCIRLLQKVYEHVEIHVGRVFEGSSATEFTKPLMKQAIEHATCKVKGWGVDVICLPSGFETEYIPITEAIAAAKFAKVLIFAAASNYGNTASIFFPAWRFRWADLFCLFSTTASAKPTSAFNPAPMDDAYNFAILGEDIRLADGKPLDGTSFSTIIAAGVAAQIIDFSLRPDTRGKIHNKEVLRQVDGMSAVFERMSTRENKYHCLTPWTLLNGMTPQEFDTEEIRTAICHTISEALRNRHKLRL
ncbi:hypothetical protein T440DRAFT_479816 [Plenodomus tracheiphilus IPT5]|uniref:DUF7580 domain-containing protein n=1 Tax=Plenodomus tracheiphilus IPT5 TaxID=1408161 RepID=A0A6A7B373_9PLEO|nr:hypothetical protein T440DRAFT_479816 [Plenodomus tracheiphilus IPT5]